MKCKAYSQLFLSFLVLLSLFFLFRTKVLAVTVTITQYPSLITQDTFTVTASISGATSGTNYVRIDLYKDGTTNYFGETYNGTDWYSGSDYHQYLAVPIVNGQWSGTIQGSLGSPSTTSYDGTGTYRMRIRRYTGGGTTNATEADSSSIIVSIVTPTPTPTPTNTPIPTATPFPTSTPKPTSSPTPSPTQKPSPISPTSEVLSIATSSSFATNEGDLLTDEEILSPTPIQKVAGVTRGFMPNVFLIIGGVILIGCGILFFYRFKNNDTDSTNE